MFFVLVWAKLAACFHTDEKEQVKRKKINDSGERGKYCWQEGWIEYVSGGTALSRSLKNSCEIIVDKFEYYIGHWCK